MRHSIKIGPEYVRAEMVGRTSAKQTRRFVDRQVAALRESGLRRLLVSVRASRPLFKVPDWDFLSVLDGLAEMKGLKVTQRCSAGSAAWHCGRFVTSARPWRGSWVRLKID